MPGISTGCDLGIQFPSPNPFDEPKTIFITAIVAPAISPLVAGEAIKDTAGWSVFVSTNNYVSSASDSTAAIVRVSPFFTGAASSASDPLAEGETAGFFLEVEDSDGSTRIFSGGSTTIPVSAPTVSLSPTSAVIAAATQAGSAIADITIGGGLATPTLSGPDAGLFIIDGSALILADEAIEGSYSVNVDVSNAGGSESATFSLDVINTLIASVEAPVAAPLHDGQSVHDMANWSTLIDAANYITAAGSSIVSVTPNITGAASAIDTALAAGQQVTISLDVEDDLGNTETFDLGQITVQYSYTVNLTAANVAVIDINPIVADAWMISVTKTGAYEGTYNTTAGAIRSGPVNLALPSVADDGDVQAGGGEVLTADDGFWIAEDTTTFSYQWQRDGVDIPGASSDTYITVAGDGGTDITVEVTASDETAESATVSIPSGSSSLAATELMPQAVFSGGSVSLDLSGADEGDTIVLAVTCRDNANTFSFSTATFNGVSLAPPVAHSSAAAAGRHEVLFFTFARPATAVADFTVTHSEAISNREIVAWKVPGASLTPHDTYAPATLPNGAGAYTGGTMGVVNGGVVLAAWAYDNTTAPSPQMLLTPSTLQSGVVRDEEWGTDTFMGNAVEAISATSTSRSIEADTQDTDGVSFAAISLEAA